jgi:hypothetical protein
MVSASIVLLASSPAAAEPPPGWNKDLQPNAREWSAARFQGEIIRNEAEIALLDRRLRIGFGKATAGVLLFAGLEPVAGCVVGEWAAADLSVAGTVSHVNEGRNLAEENHIYEEDNQYEIWLWDWFRLYNPSYKYTWDRSNAWTTSRRNLATRFHNRLVAHLAQVRAAQQSCPVPLHWLTLGTYSKYYTASEGRTFTTAGGTVTAAAAGGPKLSTAGVYAGQYRAGAIVTITEKPVEGARFLGWSGDCTSAGMSPTCTLMLTRDSAVKATYIARVYTLTVDNQTKADGYVVGPGISCGSIGQGGPVTECAAGEQAEFLYPSGGPSSVTLRIYPGQYFTPTIQGCDQLVNNGTTPILCTLFIKSARRVTVTWSPTPH